jgi:hypothetical protein
MMGISVTKLGPCARRFSAAIFATFMVIASIGAEGAQAQTAQGGQVLSTDVAARLMEAVFNNDLESVKTSIADGADFEARGKLGRNALELAIDLGHFQIAHYFLALRQHRRKQVTQAAPARPAAPPPFVPLQAEPPPSPVAKAAPRQTSAPAPKAMPSATKQLRPPPAAKAATAKASPLVAKVPAVPVAPVIATAVPPPGQKSPPVAATAPTTVTVPRASKPPRTMPARETAADDTPPQVAAVSTGPERASSSAPGIVGLGESHRLGQAPRTGSGPGAGCVVKRRGAVQVCVEPADWPASVADHFIVDAFLYKGVKAMVRYEEGVATRLYAQFATTSFDAVAAFYAERLGPATESVGRETSLREGGGVTNRTMTWKTDAPQGGSVRVVEIREFDDVRRKSVDGRYGAVQVYYQGSNELFSRLSSLDLMRLRGG